MTPDTKNNLLLFLLSNNDCNDNLVFNVHTKIGQKMIEKLIENTNASTKFSQARYFSSREEKWEHLKKKNAALLELEKMLL